MAHAQELRRIALDKRLLSSNIGTRNAFYEASSRRKWNAGEIPRRAKLIFP